jgi:hypothetical protein
MEKRQLDYEWVLQPNQEEKKPVKKKGSKN